MSKHGTANYTRSLADEIKAKKEALAKEKTALKELQAKAKAEREQSKEQREAQKAVGKKARHRLIVASRFILEKQPAIIEKAGLALAGMLDKEQTKEFETFWSEWDKARAERKAAKAAEKETAGVA